EDPADEDSADAETADAFDGAALKIKDGANVYLAGSGTLTIDASACKNGIKVGDEDTPSFVIDGDLTVNITAANDGINSGYDLTILNGKLNITASDDAIHADRILTIGSSDGSGPEINVLSSKEALEGTVVNLFGGKGTVKASDDAVNAANSDGTYKDTLTYSINITGGTWDITCTGGDGLDSNGNVNITGGSTTISSAYNGGEAGIDYDGSLYVEEGTLTNLSGVSGPDGMGGRMNGGMNSRINEGMNGRTNEGTGGRTNGDTNERMPGNRFKEETADKEQSDTSDDDQTEKDSDEEMKNGRSEEDPEIRSSRRNSKNGSSDGESSAENTAEDSQQGTGASEGNFFQRTWASIRNFFAKLFNKNV
ncbi:MAG: carbohydrate-binding domain-containing protein, partial [Lachnospiraceae bacterium]|nr:carbohydrate-binding domain-containing protein [Lachnospiraceae bacterium]